MNRAEFGRAVRSAAIGHDRIATFGALLARESGLGNRLMIAGGSAIEVYLTSSRYVSGDIDVVGRKKAIEPVLEKWGFTRRPGRDHRTYWYQRAVGMVDLVGIRNRTGLPPRRQPTPYGEVSLSPVEALVVRRLVRAAREHSTDLLRQAQVLVREYGDGLDWDYITAEARFERVQSLLPELMAASRSRHRR